MMPCAWCGDEPLLEIGEIWGHDFTIQTCCETRHEEIVTEMADDPAWATGLLRYLGAEELTGYRLRRLYDDAFSPPVLDFKLTIEPVSFAAMQAFVGDHHTHCAPPVCWRFGAAIHNGRTRIGVVSIGNPVAPALMSRGWVEVNRLCVRRDTAPQLVWNACSQLYGYAAREAASRGFRKIITYTRKDEMGTSLVAAGWNNEAVVRGRSRHSVRRPRSNQNSWIDKVRWGRELQPQAAAVKRPRREDPVTSWMHVETSQHGL